MGVPVLALPCIPFSAVLPVFRSLEKPHTAYLTDSKSIGWSLEQRARQCAYGKLDSYTQYLAHEHNDLPPRLYQSVDSYSLPRLSVPPIEGIPTV